MIITRNPSGSDDWVQWRNPLRIYACQDADEILATLRQIEHHVAHGRCALGFLAYEAGQAFDRHFRVHPAAHPSMPLLWFAIFEGHEEFITPPRATSGPRHWMPSIDPRGYRQAVKAIKRHIAAGETYQVNYTFPLITNEPVALRELFFELAESQPTPYAMLIETEEFSIASASPELFFSLDGQTIRVEPMKGTCPRGPLPELDRLAGEQLRQSEKNRAENIMIVDMMRNDLGRIAVPGSVNVEALFNVTAWPTLWQMTSTVTAATNASVPDIFAALFPCASITGAPKLKTSEIIASLEVSPRGLYTGAIGWWLPDRRARFAVAIRTLVTDIRKQETRYGIGSGIVWDSQPADEYRECLLKARIVNQPSESFQLLETMRWEPVSGFILIDGHLKRMKQSADYFRRPFDAARAEQQLRDTALRFPAVAQRIRLLVKRNGSITIEHEDATQPGHFTGPDGAPEMTAQIDSRRMANGSPFIYHKTTRRTLYKQARQRCPHADETLLVNRHSELMEFTNGNVVVRLGGKLLTPPVSAGLLPGVFREKMIAEHVIQPATVTVTDLARADEVYFINSVRGWRKVNMIAPE